MNGDAVPVPIDQIDYLWAGKPGRVHPDIVGWYQEFEEHLRENRTDEQFTAHCLGHHHNLRFKLWRSVKTVHDDVVREMTNKGYDSIVEGLLKPLHVFFHVPVDKYLPRQGNQRLCVLRSRNYTGNVPCIILPR